MPEIIFNGPDGRLEGRYHHGAEPTAPVALVLHPHPRHGGTMNNKVVYRIYQVFQNRGFSVLRFNFRGVGRSQGEFDQGAGELNDAAAALDWMQSVNPNARTCWVAGFSFGAWIAMQLLMRRPEISGFISVAPPANMYDFSFLAPCPSSGIIIQGNKDTIATPEAVAKLADKLRAQKQITVDYTVIDGADHLFTERLPDLIEIVEGYLESRLAPDALD